MSTLWEKQPAFVPTDRFAGPIVIKDKKFVIAPYHSTYCKSEGLCLYDANTKKWKSWIAYPDDIRTSYHTAAYDKKNKKLYIYNKESLLIIVDIEREECTVKRVQRVGKYAASVVIDGEFHLIGGFTSNKHLKWDAVNEKFDEVFHFREWGFGYYLHKLVYIESKGILLCLGGYTTSTRSSRSTDHIYLYDINKNKWHRSSVSMPRRMYSFGCILTPNQKHVVLFGGNTTDHIHIFDLTKQTMIRLDMHCPTSGGFEACVTGDKNYDNYVVACFVGQQWKLSHFHGMKPLSYDILEILQRWYSNEEVHLIHATKKEHWKINLAFIMNAYQRQISKPKAKATRLQTFDF